ncbi:MAG: primosomal protein N' [Chromatiales bacterium]
MRPGDLARVPVPPAGTATARPAVEAGRLGILQVAVDAPVRQLFDYLPPEDWRHGAIHPGTRVKVPFGRAVRVGVVLGTVGHSEVGPGQLKAALTVLDDAPLWSAVVCSVLRWASAYYHHAVGEVFATAMPSMLRKPRAHPLVPAPAYRLVDSRAPVTCTAGRPAPRQSALLDFLRLHGGKSSLAALERGFPRWHIPMRALLRRGLVAPVTVPVASSRIASGVMVPPLTRGQHAAVVCIRASLGTFQAFLLSGITGSGKTEVYLQVIDAVLKRGEQALVLVPEISLTAQTMARFEARFGGGLAVLHSGITEVERTRAFLRARSGDAPIIIGTRSAVWTPMRVPGVIVVDEEHDLSYKQRDGFRYCARDVAVMRARREGVPVILGSATPSLESLANARAGRYRELTLPSRPGAARLPTMQVLDLRNRALHGGLCEPLLETIDAVVARREQVLVFLNRRGYAPVLMCHGCGASTMCRRCDARMTYHRDGERMACHHCGTQQPVPQRCVSCGSAQLFMLGQGTERLAEVLRQRFGPASVVRIDRDATRRKGELNAALDQARAGTASILVGTQMLAKGHDFPRVTLVAVADADAQLYSADLRASERLAQLIIQVAGRAGRRDRPGGVIIQTHHPEHPLLRQLVQDGYAGVCDALLGERRSAGLPPYSFLALLQAEAPAASAPAQFLADAYIHAAALAGRGVEVFGPAPASMARRAGRHRAQLLLQAHTRAALHTLLDALIPRLIALRSARRVRWSLDVDPQELL